MRFVETLKTQTEGQRMLDRQQYPYYQAFLKHVLNAVSLEDGAVVNSISPTIRDFEKNDIFKDALKNGVQGIQIPEFPQTLTDLYNRFPNLRIIDLVSPKLTSIEAIEKFQNLESMSLFGTMDRRF
jgi:hypothetical protein